jgi:acyl carrier protein
MRQFGAALFDQASATVERLDGAGGIAHARWVPAPCPVRLAAARPMTRRTFLGGPMTDDFVRILRTQSGDSDAEPFDPSPVSTLAEIGIDSLGVVQLIDELEDFYNLEIPDALLTEEVFRTVGSVWAALDELIAER